MAHKRQCRTGVGRREVLLGSTLLLTFCSSAEYVLALPRGSANAEMLKAYNAAFAVGGDFEVRRSRLCLRPSCLHRLH